jgi:hypothetical protein
MGKASSAKKVARVARAGGRTSTREPRGLLFPASLVIVVVLGVSLVVYGRAERRAEDRAAFPQLGDHIHTALGVNVCGEFKGPLPEFTTPVGIHTHSDGLIHVEPTSALAVGSNAVLERFIDDARDDGGLDIELSAGSLNYLGETYEEGVTECEGVEGSQLRMGYWSEAGAETPEVTTGDFGDRLLTDDGAALTLYFGAPDAEIPKPPSTGSLPAVGAVPDSDASTTTTMGVENTTQTSAEPPATNRGTEPGP